MCLFKLPKLYLLAAAFALRSVGHRVFPPQSYRVLFGQILAFDRRIPEWRDSKIDAQLLTGLVVADAGVLAVSSPLTKPQNECIAASGTNGKSAIIPEQRAFPGKQRDSVVTVCFLFITYARDMSNTFYRLDNRCNRSPPTLGLLSSCNPLGEPGQRRLDLALGE